MDAFKKRQSTSLVAPTRAEIEIVRARIRAALKSSGRLIGEEKEFQVFDSLSWTEAQKRDARPCRPGMALRFHRDKSGFTRGESVEHIVVLKGGMGAKQRRVIAEQLTSIPDGEERVLLAKGRYVGEGLDDGRLGTLFLAMPISWRGTLRPHVGRLHRLHAIRSGSSP